MTQMPEQLLKPIKRSRLYEEVVERLKEFIDVQQLKPGDRLMSERELAERLGVSRTSVRQALTALRVLGLVDIRHGDGIYLTRPPDAVLPSLARELIESHEHLPAVVEVREAIESQTSRLAARRRTPTDLTEMRAALDEMACAIETGDDPANGDERFHWAITRASRNPILLQLWEQLAERIDQTRRASLARPGRPPHSLAAHELILEAIEAGNEERSSAMMREHLAVVADLGFLTTEVEASD